MSTTSATKQWVFSDVGHCLAFGFGAGLTPKIPGTAGTVLAFPLYWLSAQWLWQIQWLLVLVLIVLGIWLCGRACRALGQHDDSGVEIQKLSTGEREEELARIVGGAVITDEARANAADLLRQAQY
jgi:membrane protein implicated in regulation of membrane protease activity